MTCKAFEWTFKGFRFIAKENFDGILTRDDSRNNTFQKKYQTISTNELSNESLSFHFLILERKIHFFSNYLNLRKKNILF